MALGRSERAWARTAALMATIINSQPGRTTAVSPDELNPHKMDRPDNLPKADISVLKSFLPLPNSARI